MTAIMGRPRNALINIPGSSRAKLGLMQELRCSYMENSESLLLTAKEAAQLLSVGYHTLQAWGGAGHGPEPINVGRPNAKRRTIRYRRSDVLDFIGGRRHE